MPVGIFMLPVVKYCFTWQQLLLNNPILSLKLERFILIKGREAKTKWVIYRVKVLRYLWSKAFLKPTKKWMSGCENHESFFPLGKKLKGLLKEKKDKKLKKKNRALGSSFCSCVREKKTTKDVQQVWHIIDPRLPDRQQLQNRSIRCIL